MKPEIQLLMGADTNELIIREGKALELKEPVAVSINGTLSSPRKWINKRVNTIDQLTCHILVDREKLTIDLDVNETDQYGPTIQGKLELHPLFLRFGINAGTYISAHDMAKLFKMNRSAFEVQGVAMQLVTDLRNFRAKVDREVEKANDQKGNKRDLLAQTVTSNLPDSFRLNIPIFKGTDKQLINVEVDINADDLSCTLVSAHAADLIEQMRDEQIDKELQIINNVAPNIVIIEK